jgi:uncharacterized Zn-binding protein involved in type VI secretion
VGNPTVLIGGVPAARVGDMHVCPLVNPGVPPPPHVGGPGAMGSPMVLIGGMPAVRMGDMTVCAGPPDVVALGCPTVLIGEAGGGAASGGGPPGAGTGAVVAAHMSSAMAQTDNNESSTKEEHWVEIQFVDKADNPVSGIRYKFGDPDGNESQGVLRMDGTIRRDGISEGQCSVVLMSVSNAKWSKDEAEVGEKVEMTADVEGFEDGTPALVQIYKRDIKGPDKIVARIEKEVQGGKIEAEWEYQLEEIKNDQGDSSSEQVSFSYPVYYFDIIVANCIAHSGLLEYKDFIELELKDIDNNPCANEEFILYCPNGEVKRGKLDSKGYKKIEKIIPGKYFVRYPNTPDAQEYE